MEIVTETASPSGEGVFEWVPPIKKRWTIKSPSHPQIICGRCGTIDHNFQKEKPKSITELIEDGIRLCERIEETQYEIDRSVFFDIIQEKKRIQELSNRDAKIIDEALRESVSRD